MQLSCTQNLTNLKSYLRLANQLGEFVSDLEQFLGPLKPLLSSKNAHTWKEPLKKAFDKFSALTKFSRGLTLGGTLF